MFYSYDILTNRRHGIATIWLMATLGSTTTLKKKVPSKNIMSVNLPKAIETILMPAVPLALRLQSNLLYGVSRVYLHKCNYTLKQAQNAHDQMLKMLAIAKKSDIDIDTAQSERTDQLVLQDDPSFAPELLIAPLDDFFPPIDLLDEPGSRNASTLSPRATQSSRSSHGPIPGILVPSSDSGHTPLGGGIGSVRSETGSQGVRTLARADHSARPKQEQLLLEDPIFTIDEDGSLRDLDGPMLDHHHSAQDGSERPASAIEDQMDLDVAPPLAMDDGYDAEFLAPEADSQPRAPNGDYSPIHERLVNSRVQRQLEDDEGSDYAAAASRRRPKSARALPLDYRVELNNNELRSFIMDYAEHMKEAAEVRFRHQAHFIAKTNAQYWVWGRGIGGIGAELSNYSKSHPLKIFYGPELYKNIMGMTMPGHEISSHSTPAKRKHADDVEGRRIRLRTGSPHEELGCQTYLADIDSYDLGAIEDEPELGRGVPTPLAVDYQSYVSSSMPWNRSASFYHGGSVGSTARGLLIQRRAGRLTSASPLVGRGSLLPGIRSRDGSMSKGSAVAGGSASSALGDYDDAGLLAGLDDTGDVIEGQSVLPYRQSQLEPQQLEQYGAAAYVDTQTAAESQWTRAVLDHECGNFLEFLKSAISERQDNEPGVTDTSNASIMFEDILPAASNTAIVAAQGLLHALALATKSLLRLEQQEPNYGDISMTPL